MLKLKRVEIQGFKSFYDRTEMKFNGSGIAAVVGPNGCGKSNLSDAISWVLGEQSAKSLRGARMEDVIFAGTRDKKPLSMASVTMTLVPDEGALTAIHLGKPEVVEAPANTNGFHPEQNGHHQEAAAEPAPVEHTPIKPDVVKAAEQRGEITITRRLYRSGESEYLINGKQARLRDIQELFLGTGLGPESYAIIEQGRIGQILSNKPADRRSVIEEAAGITKFKTRKRLAEARLENAKQNLSRVFDILEEVTRQVNSLKRQAAKTKRYGELKSEAIGYLRQVLTAKFKVLEQTSAQVAIELNLATAELTKVQAALEEADKNHTQTAEKSQVTVEQLRQARQTLSDLQLEAERVRGRIASQSQQLEQIEKRLESAKTETVSLAQEQQVRAAEFGQETAALRELQEQLSASRAQLEAKNVARQEAQRTLSAKESALEQLRQQVLRILNESSTLKNRITQLEAQLGGLDRDAQRSQAEEQQSLSDLERVERLKAELATKLQARQTELISVSEQRREAEQRLGQQKQSLSHHRQELDRFRTEFSRIKARRESLESILQHRSYTTETVKRLFTAAEGQKLKGLSPIGVLGDFVEVDTRIEKAAEEFLHEELEFVVVQGWSEAANGIELMRGELNGRATFLVESAGAPMAASSPSPRQVPLEEGKVEPLSASLRLTNGLTSLPVEQLPRIANCYITADRELAQNLAPQFPECWFLTNDGVSFQGHTVTGGKKSGAGPLALKRELREVRMLEGARERDLNAAQKEVERTEKEIQSLTHTLDHLRNRQQTEEKDVLALDHESRKLGEELQRTQARLSKARMELGRVAADRVRLEEAITRDRASLENVEAQRSEQEQALENSRIELTGLQKSVAAIAEEHAGIRAATAQLEERQRGIGAHCARLDHQLRELLARKGNLEKESERLTEEHAQLTASNTELTTKRTELASQIESQEKSVAELAAVEAELRAALTAIEENTKALRTESQKHSDRRAELQVAMARAESDLQHLDETCKTELELPLAELAAQHADSIPAQVSLTEIEQQYAEVRRKIDALGPINSQALEEYEEAQQRQEFLTVQRQDLLDSIRDTEQAISELDQESKKRFVEAFRAINANFKELFQTLFGGGTGEMRLADEENASESGIDIVAQPPGKRLQSVLLLSGGEKSLTAMALLMAIFQYTPSPFCVLDEVDAPLDEPNTERLTKLIRQMAEQTQFILITHSKRTMEAAQSLYGVTMQEPGVSKLVSVKFKEEQKHRAAAATANAQVEQLEPVLA